MSYLLHVCRLFLRNPFKACATTLRFFSEWRLDRRIGVATLLRQFEAPPSGTGDSHPCQPVPYVVLEVIAGFIVSEGLPRTAFYDMGCGAGRPLAYLSSLGFEKMTGIEINPDVAARARRNIARIKPSWRRAGTIEVVTGDVLTTPLALDGGIVYLANPFGKATMDAFAGRLKAHLLANPGLELHLLYAHPHYGESFEAAFPAAPRKVLEGLQRCSYYRLSAAAIPVAAA